MKQQKATLPISHDLFHDRKHPIISMGLGALVSNGQYEIMQQNNPEGLQLGMALKSLFWCGLHVTWSRALRVIDLMSDIDWAVHTTIVEYGHACTTQRHKFFLYTSWKLERITLRQHQLKPWGTSCKDLAELSEWNFVHFCQGYCIWRCIKLRLS